MSEQLYYMHHAYAAEISAFVLMANHFHLLVRFPENNISKAMGTFMRETSRLITKSALRINQTYGQRHFRTILLSHHYYLHAYKYLYRNPVNAGVSKSVEEYPFSTLPALLGRLHTMIPLAEDVTLFSDVEGTLQWLNREPDQEAWSRVRCALKKPHFKLAKDKQTNTPNKLEFDTL